MPFADPPSPPAAFAPIACRICGGATRLVYTLTSRRHSVAVPVGRCTPCDAYFSSGGPVNYDDVDLTGYYLQFAAAIRERYERVFARVERLCRPGRFLDIGAGIGFSLEVAAQRGWASRELEPNKHLVRHAQGRGLDIACGYLDESIDDEYDLILIDNVLEHVPDPVAFVRSAARLLGSRGMLLIAVPPLDWLRKGLGAIPFVRDRVERPQLNVFNEVDEHLNMLGRRAMKRLLDVAGLRVLPTRLHHSKACDNPAYRAFGLDDGYYLTTRT